MGQASLFRRSFWPILLSVVLRHTAVAAASVVTLCYGNCMIDSEITLGLVTALPVEAAALRMVVDGSVPWAVAGDPNLYSVGWLPARGARRHRVVMVNQVRDGRPDAASVSADMARSFPGLRAIVLCGIAGGVVRRWHGRALSFGDVVSATEGVVDYGHVRVLDGGEELRRQTDGLSKLLLRADRELEIGERVAGDIPEQWLSVLEGMLGRSAGRFRRARRPRVHRGALGSADKLVRSAVARDGIAEKYGVCAVEMEGSGVAVGADLHELHWFMVRGIADRCDEAKDDSWHRYAALAAAAYTRALLGEVPAVGNGGVGDLSARMSTAALAEVVDALLGLSLMRDDNRRRAFLDVLPVHIRTQMTDSQVGRLHVMGLVQACERFDGGREALVAALRVALGEGSGELAQVVAVLDRWWPVQGA